jgi:hypothetical protein
VDDTEAGNGNTEAGHIGHDGNADEWPTIGWYCGGGNFGNPVFSIHPADIPAALKLLEKLPAGALDENIKAGPWDGLRIEWHV